MERDIVGICVNSLVNARKWRMAAENYVDLHELLLWRYHGLKPEDLRTPTWM